MNWVDAALFIGAVLGITLGVALVVRTPTFWTQVGIIAFEKLRPVITSYVLKRMTPEEEKMYHDAIRRGTEWDPFRKRPRDK